MSWAFNEKGSITQTLNRARAWKPCSANRCDVRRVAVRMHRQADGLERQAGFARDEGNDKLARECLAHAARLRREADSSPV